MTEARLHTGLFLLAVAGLLAGIVSSLLPSPPVAADWLWTGATIPVIAALGATMLRDFLAGRVGVDAIAFVSMTAALALGEPLRPYRTIAAWYLWQSRRILLGMPW